MAEVLRSIRGLCPRGWGWTQGCTCYWSAAFDLTEPSHFLPVLTQASQTTQELPGTAPYFSLAETVQWRLPFDPGALQGAGA